MTTRTSIEIRTIHGEDLHNLLRDESARTEYAPLRIRGEIPDGKAPIICVEGARGRWAGLLTHVAFCCAR